MEDAVAGPDVAPASQLVQAAEPISVTAEALEQVQAVRPARRRAPKAPVVVKGVDGSQEVSINADLEWLVEWLQEIQDRAPRWLDAELSASIKSGMSVGQLHELLAKAPDWEMERLQNMLHQTERHTLAMDRTFDEDYTRNAVDNALERIIAEDEGRGRKQEEPEAEVWRFLMDAWDRQVEAAKKIQAAFRAFKARHPERFVKKEEVKSRYMDDPRLQGTRRASTSESEAETEYETETEDSSDAETVDKTPPLRFPPILLQPMARRTRAPPGPRERVGFGSSSSARLLKPEPPKAPTPTFRRKSVGGTVPSSSPPFQPQPQPQPFRARANPRHSDMGQAQPKKPLGSMGQDKVALPTVLSEELPAVAESTDCTERQAEEASTSQQGPPGGAASAFAAAAAMAPPGSHQELNDAEYEALIKSIQDSHNGKSYDTGKLGQLHSRMRDWQFQHASYSNYLLHQYDIVEANDAEYQALVKSIHDSHGGRQYDSALLGKLHAQMRDRQFQQGQATYSKYLAQQYEIAEKQQQSLPEPGDTRWPLLSPVADLNPATSMRNAASKELAGEEPVSSEAAAVNEQVNDEEYEALLKSLQEQQQITPLGSSGKKYDAGVLERLHATMRHRHYHQPGYAKCLLEQYEVSEHFDADGEMAEEDEDLTAEEERRKQEEAQRLQALLHIELNQWRIEQEKQQRIQQLGALEEERQWLEVRKSQQLQELTELEAERERERERQEQEEQERKQREREEQELQAQQEREERRRRFQEDQLRRQQELEELGRLEEEQQRLEQRRQEMKQRLEEEQLRLEEQQRLFEEEQQRLAERRRQDEQRRLEQEARQMLEQQDRERQERDQQQLAEQQQQQQQQQQERKPSPRPSGQLLLEPLVGGQSRDQSDSGSTQLEPAYGEGALLLPASAPPLAAAVAHIDRQASGRKMVFQPLKITESPIDSGTASPIASNLLFTPAGSSFGDQLATSLTQLSSGPRDVVVPRLGLSHTTIGGSSRLKRVSMPGAEDASTATEQQPPLPSSSDRPEEAGPELSFAPESSVDASPSPSQVLRSMSTPLIAPAVQQSPCGKASVASVSQHGTPFRPADKAPPGGQHAAATRTEPPAQPSQHRLGSGPGRPSPGPDYGQSKDPLELMRLHLAAMQQSMQVMQKDVQLVQRKVMGSTGGMSSTASSPMHLLGGGHVATASTGGLLRKSQGNAVQLEDYLGEISKVYGPRRAAYLASAAGLLQPGSALPEHRNPGRSAHSEAGTPAGPKHHHDSSSSSPHGFLPAIRSTSNTGQAGSPGMLSIRKPLAGGFNINASY